MTPLFYLTWITCVLKKKWQPLTTWPGIMWTNFLSHFSIHYGGKKSHLNGYGLKEKGQRFFVFGSTMTAETHIWGRVQEWYVCNPSAMWLPNQLDFLICETVGMHFYSLKWQFRAFKVRLWEVVIKFDYYKKQPQFREIECNSEVLLFNLFLSCSF